MKPLILTLSTLLISSPVHAITWEEFWEPFTNDTHHHHYYERHYRYEPRYCERPHYYEKYVPGDRWSPGYVKRWTIWKRVPCYD